MMAHFANFTGKLSHGMYKSPANHFSLAWSADQTGAHAQPGVRRWAGSCSQPDEAFVVDVSDGGAEYFTVPLSNIWGTTLDVARPDRQPQQGAVAWPTRTAPTPT